MRLSGAESSVDGAGASSVVRLDALPAAPGRATGEQVRHAASDAGVERRDDRSIDRVVYSQFTPPDTIRRDGRVEVLVSSESPLFPATRFLGVS